MKNITDTLTPLMDKFRDKTNLTDKLSIKRATGLLDHLQLIVNPNLIKADYVNSFAVSSDANKPAPEWQYRIVYEGLAPNTTYTLSLSAVNTSGVKQASVRIFVEYYKGKYVNKEITSFMFSADNKRKSFTFTTDDNAYYNVCLYAGPLSVSQGKSFVTTYHNIKLEKGDLATPLTEVWGG
jgi:hypothetical protein